MVRARKRFRSPARCQGIVLSRPMIRLRATAAMIAMRGGSVARAAIGFKTGLGYKAGSAIIGETPAPNCTSAIQSRFSD